MSEWFSGNAGAISIADLPGETPADSALVPSFSLSVVAGESIQIGLDLDPLRNNTPFNGSLSLLDSSGATLVSVNDLSTNSSTAAGTGSLTATTPYAPSES